MVGESRRWLASASMDAPAFTHARRGLIVASLLAFVLPWLVWSTTIAEQHGLLGWHLPPSLAFWIGLPVAYLAGAAAGGGRAALTDLLGRLLRWRVGWVPYLAAAGLAVGLPVVVWLGVLLSGDAGPTTSPGQLPLALLIEVALFWLTEEALWRGFLLPRVELWLPRGAAGAAVGVLWAVWHLPLFAIDGSFQSSLPYAGFAVLTVATSVILSWLYHLGSGAVLVCALYHGLVDVTFAFTGVLGASSAAFWVVVGVHVAAAGLLWWRGGLRPSVVATVEA